MRLVSWENFGIIHYRPHPKDGEGNVFTGVCLSVHRGTGVPEARTGYPPSLPSSRPGQGFQNRPFPPPQDRARTVVQCRWYASCVHAGGLSCLNAKAVWKPKGTIVSLSAWPGASPRFSEKGVDLLRVSTLNFTNFYKNPMKSGTIRSVWEVARPGVTSISSVDGFRNVINFLYFFHTTHFHYYRRHSDSILWQSLYWWSFHCFDGVFVWSRLPSGLRLCYK